MQSETKYTKQDLETMRAWSLQRKIQVTQTRIIEWIGRYADKIREMDDEALAVAIMCPHDDDKCPGPGDAKTCIKCCLDWLRESAEG